MTKSRFFKALLGWFLAVVLSALVFDAARAQTPYGANHQPSQVFQCRSKLANSVNRAYMSKATANRIALRICREWRDERGELGHFYRAFTR